jgi:hypothetical protein
MRAVVSYSSAGIDLRVGTSALGGVATALVRAALLALGGDCDARSTPTQRHSAVDSCGTVWLPLAFLN